MPVFSTELVMVNWLDIRVAGYLNAAKINSKQLDISDDSIKSLTILIDHVDDSENVEVIMIPRFCFHF